MARKKSWVWTAIISLSVGVALASLFWRYSPYGQDRLAPQDPGDAKSLALPPEVKGGAVNLKQLPSQATGSRFQMVTDGKQVFLADLQDGRVWRYFRQTKEEGFSREDEGFLPIALYYAGQKHYNAAEIEPPPVPPGIPPRAAPPGNRPQ
jgi:hypothetical protein